MFQSQLGKLTLVLVSVPLWLTGCGNNSSSGGGGAATVATEAADLQGTWALPCQNSSSGSVSSSQAFMQFSGTSMTVMGNVYTTANCIGASVVTINLPGSYTTNGAASVSGATNISGTFSSEVQITVETTAAASSLNSQSYCGITTWTAGVAQSVATSNSCIGGSLSVLSGNDIYEVSGNSLYFGNSGDTALNTSAASTYTRQ